MNRTADAELHFDRSIALAPADDQAHYFYGRWLFQTGRTADALTQLEMAVRLNSSDLLARDLLASAFNAVGERAEARATAEAALRLAPGDAAAQAILAQSPAESAADLINASLYRYRMGDYAGCLAVAQQALKLDPHSAVAYTNIGAAYAGLKQWDPAIASEREALRLQPDFTLAKNNLALYTLEKAGSAVAHPANMTAEDWLNASLHDNQAGQYEKSIADARAALRLRPDYAEAYNNIAAAYTSLGQWDLAITAAETAVRLKPDFQLAKNNLSWALAQKKRAAH
jgi:tetratricopeptide (TPR) repeat protein